MSSRNEARVKSAVVIVIAVFVALAVVHAAPAGLAQDEADTSPSVDQPAPTTACPPAGDDQLADGSLCPATGDADSSLLAQTPAASDTALSEAGPSSSDESPPADPPAEGDLPPVVDSPPIDSPPVDSPPVVDSPGSDAPQVLEMPSEPTPIPVPTDTPVPPPTDTPVPPPTDTPTPIPTDTPTPVPVPTDTPVPTATATSSSKDVPVGTLSRQLPFSSPGDTFCEVVVDAATQAACDPQTFPAVVTLQLSSSSSSGPFTVQVDSRKPETTSASSWDFLSAPGSGIGPGDHTVTVSQPSQGSPVSARLRLKVLPPSSPHLLVYPRTAAPGSKAQVWLAGYPATTTLPLGLYRKRQGCDAFAQNGGDCYELATDLGTVTTSSSGVANKTFQIPANEPRLPHLVATPAMKIDPKDPFTSLQTYGKPWFGVD
jgi:hypothetical protein